MEKDFVTPQPEPRFENEDQKSLQSVGDRSRDSDDDQLARLGVSTHLRS